MARKLVLEGPAAAAVERLARSAGVSPAELIRRALRREDEAQRRQEAILRAVAEAQAEAGFPSEAKVRPAVAEPQADLDEETLHVVAGAMAAVAEAMAAAYPPTPSRVVDLTDAFDVEAFDESLQEGVRKRLRHRSSAPPEDTSESKRQDPAGP